MTFSDRHITNPTNLAGIHQELPLFRHGMGFPWGGGRTVGWRGGLGPAGPRLRGRLAVRCRGCRLRAGMGSEGSEWCGCLDSSCRARVRPCLCMHASLARPCAALGRYPMSAAGVWTAALLTAPTYRMQNSVAYVQCAFVAVPLYHQPCVRCVVVLGERGCWVRGEVFPSSLLPLCSHPHCRLLLVAGHGAPRLPPLQSGAASSAFQRAFATFLAAVCVCVRRARRRCRLRRPPLAESAGMPWF